MEQLDRRKFLQRTGAAAAAAGGVWLASDIVSSPTVFAGASCLVTATTATGTPWGRWGGAQPINWPVISPKYPNLNLTWVVAAIGTVTANTGNGTITPAIGAGFGIPNQRVFYFDISNAGSASVEGYSVTFTFSAPVWNVTFRVYDIDRNTGGGQNYIDRVAVTAVGGATVSGTASGGTAPSGSGATFTGSGTNAADNGAVVDYTLSGKVTSFTLSYTNAIASGTGSQQIIGIGDLRFCR